jgi:hypothetical protein
VLRDLASGCTPTIYTLADVIFLISWSIQDPLSFHEDTAEAATQGRICRYPFGDVGDRGLMFSDYLVLHGTISIVVRNLKYYAQIIHVPIDLKPPDSCPLSILSCLSTMSFPSERKSLLLE